MSLTWPKIQRKLPARSPHCQILGVIGPEVLDRLQKEQIFSNPQRPRGAYASAPALYHTSEYLGVDIAFKQVGGYLQRITAHFRFSFCSYVICVEV